MEESLDDLVSSKPGSGRSDEILSIHSSPCSMASSAAMSSSCTSSEEETILGTSLTMESPAGSLAPIFNTQCHDLKENQASQEHAVFKLTKAPTNTTAKTSDDRREKDTKQAREKSEAASQENASRKRKILEDSTKQELMNNQVSSQQSNNSPNNSSSRRVRRTPLEAVEAERQRVQRELETARKRAEELKSKAAKRKENNESSLASGGLSQEVECLATSNPRAHSNLAEEQHFSSAHEQKVKEKELPCKASHSADTRQPVDSVTNSLSPMKDSDKLFHTDPLARKTSHSTDSEKNIPPTNKKGSKASASQSSATKPRKKKQTFDEQVLSHMLLAFKPFTLKTLAQEINSTETIVNFSMLSMVDKNLVIRKEFASASKNVKTLYWANHGATAKELSASHQATREEMQLTKLELEQLTKSEAALQRELTSVLDTASNEQLEHQILTEQTQLDNLTKQLAEVNNRIISQKQGPKLVSRTQSFGRSQVPLKSAASLAREHCPRRLRIRINKMRTEWKTRKEKCMDFVEVLADGLEKKPRDVIKLLDIETDEMLGVTMPPKHAV